MKQNIFDHIPRKVIKGSVKVHHPDTGKYIGTIQWNSTFLSITFIPPFLVDTPGWKKIMVQQFNSYREFERGCLEKPQIIEHYGGVHFFSDPTVKREAEERYGIKDEQEA